MAHPTLSWYKRTQALHLSGSHIRSQARVCNFPHKEHIKIQQPHIPFFCKFVRDIIATYRIPAHLLAKQRKMTQMDCACFHPMCACTHTGTFPAKWAFSDPSTYPSNSNDRHKAANRNLLSSSRLTSGERQLETGQTQTSFRTDLCTYKPLYSSA